MPPPLGTFTSLERLAVFVTGPDGMPRRGLPLYAEVFWLARPPAAPDSRVVVDWVIEPLADADRACRGSDECIERVRRAVASAVTSRLDPAARDALLSDEARARDFVADTVRDLAASAHPQSLLELDEESLLAHAEEAVVHVAAGNGIELRAASEGKLAGYPLGVVATDASGYASYDLTRLPASVSIAVMRAISDDSPSAASIWVFPYGTGGLAFEAVGQRRFTADAIVMRLGLDREPDLPEDIADLGLMSMQNPGISDWRLSPGSIAANPLSVLGADGCESVFPANLAVQEFRFTQSVRLTDLDSVIGLSDPAGARLAVINEYRVAWYPLGHSLGQVLYSLPLAPGESVRIAVIDWSRRDAAQRAEHTTLDEKIAHDEHRDRVVSETVEAALREYQHGSSFMGGIAGAVGGSTGAMSAGVAGSLGGATSNSSGVRTVDIDTLQQVNDHITQASSASRELNSTVVVHGTQAEQEAVETRTVANYNHSHALTMLYYELLRQYRVETTLDHRSPAVLVRTSGDPLSAAAVDSTIVQNAGALADGLLDGAFAPGIAAVQRIDRRARVAAVLAPPSPPPAPAPPIGAGDRVFGYYSFEMKTGGMYTLDMDDHGHRTEITVDLVGPTTVHGLKNPSGDAIVNQRGSFRQGDAVNRFVAVAPDPAPAWKDITGIRLWVNPYGGSEEKISFQHIRISGIDGGGGTELLVDQGYEDGHLIITDEGAHVILPVVRPAPPPAPPAPVQDVIDDAVARSALVEHLTSHAAYYRRLLVLAQDPSDRAATLAAIVLPGGATMLERVDPRPVDVVGDYVVYHCTDPGWREAVTDAVDGRHGTEVRGDERLVALPTRGVFAEAKLGHCNASEEIDNTRFWDWQSSPIPLPAPEISSVTVATPEPQQPADLSPTAFPSPMVTIVSPPNAPDPGGMAATLGALTAAGVFRDMSGRAEVADLLKKLSDNAVAIARPGGGGTGGSGTGGGTGTGGTGAGGATSVGSGAGAGSSAPKSSTPQSVSDLNTLAGGIRQQLPPAQATPLVEKLYQNAVDTTASGTTASGAIDDPARVTGSLTFTSTLPNSGERLCFPVSAFAGSQFASGFGTIAERLIENDYCATFSCTPATTYVDNNNPTVFTDFLRAHNTALTTPPKSVILSAASRAGISRPDILCDDGTRQDYYEIKPQSVSGSIAGVGKLALIQAFMTSLGLPYVPGTVYSPSKDIPIMDGIVLGEPLAVTLNVQRYAPGIVTYSICLQGNLARLLGKVTLAALLAYIAATMLAMSGGGLVLA